ncbi:MAG TPA: glycosyltransferase family 4 protein [Terriglobia bacterium]|nr:glycosyltransferase family 4 protein [Terriglobia bacterium]
MLITNIGIANRTGTEIVAMDLARSLKDAGHTAMIWAPVIDLDIVAELRNSGIPVVSKIGELPADPDIIHGHHHLETLEAVRCFPRRPAIFVIHDGQAWHDAPPQHPQILHYVAVDEFCRKRLERAPWIAKDRISVIHNAVDLKRFQPRAPLPDRPRRALIFSNNATANTHLEPVQDACARMGIELDVAGSGVGKQTSEPENLLGCYDLVFAKARCALESMAVGCAVVLCDTTGLGSMVTSTEVSYLRNWNFGFRVLSRSLEPELIANEIRRYDPADAAKVSLYVRQDADLTRAVEQYMALYRKVLSMEPPESSPDCYVATAPVQIEDQRLMSLSITSVPEHTEVRDYFMVAVRFENDAKVPVLTSPPWPSFLTYRWIEAGTGKIVIEDGFRSILQPCTLQNPLDCHEMKVIAPPVPGQYLLRVTIIQEGWRWLDHLEPKVSAEAEISVTAGRKANDHTHATL